MTRRPFRWPLPTRVEGKRMPAPPPEPPRPQKPKLPSEHWEACSDLAERDDAGRHGLIGRSLALQVVAPDVAPAGISDLKSEWKLA